MRYLTIIMANAGYIKNRNAASAGILTGNLAIGPQWPNGLLSWLERPGHDIHTLPLMEVEGGGVKSQKSKTFWGVQTNDHFLITRFKNCLSRGLEFGENLVGSVF